MLSEECFNCGTKRKFPIYVDKSGAIICHCCGVKSGSIPLPKNIKCSHCSYLQGWPLSISKKGAFQCAKCKKFFRMEYLILNVRFPTCGQHKTKPCPGCPGVCYRIIGLHNAPLVSGLIEFDEAMRRVELFILIDNGTPYPERLKRQLEIYGTTARAKIKSIDEDDMFWLDF